jgi:hypothetical protein
MAAQMMRQILSDHARKEQAANRGELPIMLSLAEASDHAPAEEPIPICSSLDDAMKRLALVDARQCQIVESRFLGGLSIEETAAAS